MPLGDSGQASTRWGPGDDEKDLGNLFFRTDTEAAISLGEFGYILANDRCSLVELALWWRSDAQHSRGAWTCSHRKYFTA
mmetsp:Transcript_11856/g.32483  ORF Transcript_11856/g.32483 Transcript_11856/m.32483 type:complete len:80 (+) Transcript_11856:966-1205(+)